VPQITCAFFGKIGCRVLGAVPLQIFAHNRPLRMELGKFAANVDNLTADRSSSPESQ